MTRSLLFTALCAFLAAIGFFVLAAVFGARDFGRHFSHDFNWSWSDRSDAGAGGPETAKTLVWSGEDELSVHIPAVITFTQGPDNNVVIKGPKGEVDHVTLHGENLEFDRRLRNPSSIEVKITAPNISEFKLMGSQKLTITGYEQDKLSVAVFGAGEVKAQGKSDKLEIGIFGSGDVDAGALTTREAEVNIAGAGDAVVAPSDAVDISIAGAGDVTLKTRPARVKTSIAGAGDIIQAPVETPPVPASPAPLRPSKPSV